MDCSSIDSRVDHSGVDTLAIQAQDVHKFYGTGRNASHVLKGLNISVPYGMM